MAGRQLVGTSPGSLGSLNIHNHLAPVFLHVGATIGIAEMDPYEADPDKIPSEDRYADVPFYGRYCPRLNDFRPDPKHFKCTSADSLKYGASVLTLCDPSVRIYENEDGGRDVFALG